jgi:hypothetical protein
MRAMESPPITEDPNLGVARPAGSLKTTMT